MDTTKEIDALYGASPQHYINTMEEDNNAPAPPTSNSAPVLCVADHTTAPEKEPWLGDLLLQLLEDRQDQPILGTELLTVIVDPAPSLTVVDNPAPSHTHERWVGDELLDLLEQQVPSTDQPGPTKKISTIISNTNIPKSPPPRAVRSPAPSPELIQAAPSWFHRRPIPALHRPSKSRITAEPQRPATSLTQPSPARRYHFQGVVVIDEAIKAIEVAQAACRIHPWDGEVALFSDGSYVTGRGSGIGVVWRRDPEKPEYEEVPKTLADAHDNNQAEAHALHHLLHLVYVEYKSDPRATKITAFSDSREVPKAVDRLSQRTSDDYLDYFMRQILCIHKETEGLKKVGKEVTLRWVKAHMSNTLSVPGNVRADRVVRMAVSGRKSKIPVLRSQASQRGNGLKKNVEEEDDEEKKKKKTKTLG